MRTKRQYSSQRVKAYLIFYLGSFALLATVWALTGDWLKYYQLKNYGVSVSGKFISASNYQIEYWAGNNRYVIQYADNLYESNSNLSDLGAEIPVVYLPQKPQTACVFNPTEAFNNATLTVVIWSSVMALLLTWGYYHFRKDYWD